MYQAHRITPLWAKVAELASDVREHGTFWRLKAPLKTTIRKVVPASARNNVRAVLRDPSGLRHVRSPPFRKSHLSFVPRREAEAQNLMRDDIPKVVEQRQPAGVDAVELCNQRCAQTECFVYLPKCGR